MLATLQDLKDFLKMTETTDDDKLYDLLRDADAEVLERCGRNFEQATVTEYHDGECSNRILLDEYPVASVTSVHDDVDRVYGADALIDAADYVCRIKTGELIYENGCFADGINNVKVVYVAGYATVPRDIKLACVKLAAANYIESAAQIEVIESSEALYKPSILRREAGKTIAIHRKIR